jgi:hypothetical protein
MLVCLRGVIVETKVTGRLASRTFNSSLITIYTINTSRKIGNNLARSVQLRVVLPFNVDVNMYG